MAGTGNLKKENGTRMLLGKQPARMLLVDASYPLMTFAEVVKDLCNTLENIFAIATNIGGPSRMPFFGLMSLSQYPELLLPLSHVKNNYSRIETSINDLCNNIGEGQRGHSNTTDCVIQGIQDACAHFHRQMKATVPQAGGLCNQLEVILLTCRPGQKVQKQIDEAIQLMNLENVKRIQVVVLNLDVDYPTLEESEILGSQSSLKSNASNNSSLSGGLVDIVSLDPDPLSLQNFFNTWLLDNSTDSEHLHIILPSDNGRMNVTIKCDLKERIINPAQLPFYGHFTVHPDSATMKTFPSTSKAIGMSIPIYKIRIHALMSSEDLCDSIIFGMPMIALATTCWKIDWDDLEKNQQLFKALCYKLIEKDQVMIGELENSVPINRSRSDQEEKPSGSFVFLPAPNGTLLVKSIAVQELLLPCQTGTTLDGATDDSVDIISSSLNQVEKIECYNPLMASSGLFQCLKKKNRKPEPKQQKRKPDTAPEREALSSSSRYNMLPVVGKSQKASPAPTHVKRLRPLLPLLPVFPTDL